MSGPAKRFLVLSCWPEKSGRLLLLANKCGAQRPINKYKRQYKRASITELCARENPDLNKLLLVLLAPPSVDPKWEAGKNGGQLLPGRLTNVSGSLGGVMLQGGSMLAQSRCAPSQHDYLTQFVAGMFADRFVNNH